MKKILLFLTLIFIHSSLYAGNVYDTRKMIEAEIKATQEFITEANQKIRDIDELNAKALYATKELANLNRKIAFFSKESFDSQLKNIEYIAEQEKAAIGAEKGAKLLWAFLDGRMEGKDCTMAA